MTPIYHLTSIVNLPSIVEYACLLCDRIVDERKLNTQSIAYDHIKERRGRWNVPCGPGGVVADYVPFFFGPKPPMLYTLAQGNVPGFGGTQADISYLVASAEGVQESGIEFVFTDGHAVMAVSNFYTDLGDLVKVDWEVVQGAWWNDTAEHPDRKRRRQAEFLVHFCLPWRLIHEIAVKTDTAAARVAKAVAGVEHRPAVVVRRDWYY